MIRIEGTPQEGLRIIGSLTGTCLSRLLEMTGTSHVVLDLSEVNEADAAAVRILARLAEGQCKFIGCSKWLALWIERERQALHSSMDHTLERSER